MSVLILREFPHSWALTRSCFDSSADPEFRGCLQVQIRPSVYRLNQSANRLRGMENYVAVLVLHTIIRHSSDSCCTNLPRGKETASTDISPSCMQHLFRILTQIKLDYEAISTQGMMA